MTYVLGTATKKMMTKQNITARKMFAVRVGELLGGIGTTMKSAMKNKILTLVMIASFSTAVSGVVNESQAMSKETKNKFVLVKESSDKVYQFRSRTETEQDSTKRAKNDIKLKELSDTLWTNFDEATVSFRNDIRALLMRDASDIIINADSTLQYRGDDGTDVIRADLERYLRIVQIFNQAIGSDSTVSAKAQELEKEINTLIQKRSIFRQIINEAVNSSKSSTEFPEAEKKLMSIFKELDEHPLLKLFVLKEGVIPTLKNLQAVAEINAGTPNNNFDVARAALQAIERISADSSITVYKEDADEIITTVRLKIVKEMYNRIESHAGRNEFSDAEQLATRMKAEYPTFVQAYTDAIKDIGNHRLAQISSYLYYGNTAEAKIAYQELSKIYPEYSTQFSDESYTFGTRVIDRVKTIVSNKDYDQALKMLSYYEIHHFKGKMLDLRKKLGAMIDSHAVPFSPQSQPAIHNWANMFREGVQLIESEPNAISEVASTLASAGGNIWSAITGVFRR